MTIRIFITGGTFDKEYDELSGKLYFKDTHMQEMLTLGRSRLACEITTLMLKDSLEMTEQDRELIIASCKECEEDRILLTHGTDTMAETAAAIASQCPDKTIVLMGAMIPFAFGSSDGLFNLGSALSFLQVIPAGTYIAMNGMLFPWDNVRKNKTLGRFEMLHE